MKVIVKTFRAQNTVNRALTLILCVIPLILNLASSRTAPTRLRSGSAHGPVGFDCIGRSLGRRRRRRYHPMPVPSPHFQTHNPSCETPVIGNEICR